MLDRLVAGYIRTSSLVADPTSRSAFNQEARLRAFGATVIYSDIGVSGYTKYGRKKAIQYNALRLAVLGGQVGKVIVVSVDRIARRVDWVMDFLRLCECHGTEVVALDSGILRPDLLANMEAAIGEAYSRQLSQRIKKGLEGSTLRGECARPASTLPFHLARQPGTRYGVVRSECWDDARYCVEKLLRREWRMSEVALFIFKRHNKLGHAASVGRWMRSKTLLGHATDGNGDVIIENCWPALVTAKEFDDLSAISKFNRRRWGSASRLAPRRLSGLCVCNSCGFPLTYQVIRQYTYLRCTNRATCSDAGKHYREEQVFAIARESVGGLLPADFDLLSSSLQNLELSKTIKQCIVSTRLKTVTIIKS